MLTGKNYVAGELTADETSVFESVNPKNNEKEAKFYNASEKDVDAAIEHRVIQVAY